MSSQRRVLIATALSLLVLILWSRWMAPPPPADVPQTTNKVQPAARRPSEPSKVPSAVPIQEAEAEAEAEEEVRAGRVRARLSSGGATLRSWQLEDYRATVEPDSPFVDLIGGGEELEPRALALSLESNEGVIVPGDLLYERTEEREYRASRGPLVVTKRYEIDPDRWWLTLHARVENRSKDPMMYRPVLSWEASQLREKGAGFGPIRAPDDRRTFIYSHGRKTTRVGLKEGRLDPTAVTGPILWAGVEERYFLAAIVSRTSGSLAYRYGAEAQSVRFALGYPERSVGAGETDSFEYSLYLGPKVRETLEAAGVGLEKAIDYGVFSILALPLLKGLRFFHTLLGNWGLAIIALTIVIKILLNPLTVKSLKSMKSMGTLKPELDALKEKYASDRQRMNLETMQLFRRHGVNPMGGCLPMLLQMPIYIVLYKVLYGAIELHHAPFFAFYKDLSAPDPYFVSPILLGVFMFVQQLLTPSAAQDPTSRMMMKIMPVMFTAFMLFLPLGLVIYILVSTVLGVSQQWMYQRNLRVIPLLLKPFKGERT